jgi:hypothetical protein
MRPSRRADLLREPPATNMSAPGATTPEEETFLAFHQLASRRKMDLAMRGLTVPNCSIDEMFEDAQKQRLPESAWSSFLRQQLPSPRDEPASSDALESGAAADDCVGLRRIAELLDGCCHGQDDVDVGALVQAGTAFVKVIEGVGAFAALSLQEARANLKKILEGAREVGFRGVRAPRSEHGRR